MSLLRKFPSLTLALIICATSKAQLQADWLSFKGYSAIGFGAFFNFSVPVSDANYITGELGLDFFSKNQEQLVVAPVLVGYRYTLNESGTGFYLEPNAGYCFAAEENKHPPSFTIRGTDFV